MNDTQKNIVFAAITVAANICLMGYVLSGIQPGSVARKPDPLIRVSSHACNCGCRRCPCDIGTLPLGAVK